MTRFSTLLGIGLVLMVGLTGCGESIDYAKEKREAGPDVKEYQLRVRGMT